MSETPTTFLGSLPHLWQRLLFPGQAAADTKTTLAGWLLVLLLPAAMLYPTRAFLLLEPDEGRYAQIPKEMLARGEWVVPTLQGEPYLDKPPLTYWLIKLSYKAFGVSEASARLVPALAVHLTILAVYAIGRRSLGSPAALWAALLLCVSPGYIGVARLLLLDGVLTLCITLSVLCGFEAIRTGRLKTAWWIAAAVASGLGFLTKGPISEVLLFPPLFVFGWLAGSTAKVSPRMLALFVGIVILVNLPWYIAIYRHEPAFLKHFFWDHNVMRFAQPFDHLQPIWYYVPLLLGGLLPGTLFLIPYGRSLLLGGPEAATTRSAAGGFWLLAGGWCVLFFSLAGSKLPTYILPAFPFLCLALGEYIARTRWNTALATRGLVGGVAAVMLAVIHIGLPWYSKERSPFGRPELVRGFLDDGQPVVTFPRNCDSVAFYVNRADFDHARSKEVNDLIVAMHHRPQTVILFTHRHSFESFKCALPETLEVTEAVSMKRVPCGVPLLDKWIGDVPWGLADVAVVRPTATARGQKP